MDNGNDSITSAARVLGSSKSKRKAIAARKNGKLGGRPPGNAHQRRIWERAQGSGTKAKSTSRV